MAYKRELIAKTKNLFDWSGKLRQYYDTVNCTIVETLTNGAILQGHIGSEPGNASYDNGWFRPGSNEGYGTAVTLSANDVVTISADYEILERNYASPTTIGVYLYGAKEMAHPYASPIETGVLYRIKDTYTITKDGQYYPVFTLNSSKVKITNIQIEKGSVATDYVPYGRLTSYKKLLKVSDVCQLLDKSKYPATQTINGVTFTNNGDGTITMNGTSTSETYSHLGITYDNVPCVKGHIYCVLGCPSGGSYLTYNCNTSWGNDIGNGNIGLFDRDIKFGNYYINVYPGYTANNIVFKPQLFDLTEMYGAGNEPKTVDEFKAKFPNELYPYSPRCWVKSYKTGLIAKTKNLFNYIPPMRKEYDGANITYLESLSNGAIVTGTVGSEPGFSNWSNGWFSPAYSSYSNTPSTPLKSGDVITVSADCTLLKAYSASSMFTRILSSDDSKVSSSIVSIPLELGKTKRISQTFTIISDIDFRPIFTLNSNKVMITNIQIEKGTTATDYVPYGYL